MPTVGTLVRQRLADQRDALRAAEAAIRAGEPTGLHDLRVAMRRIRSLLATFRPVFDRSVTEPLRAELKDASGRLGSSRDAEVATDNTDRLLEDVELAGVDEDAVAGLRARLRLDAVAAGDVIEETLDSTGYAALTLLLDELVTHPPLVDAKAQRDAAKVARKRVRHDARRFADVAAAARADNVAGGNGRRIGNGGNGTEVAGQDHGSPAHPALDHASHLHEVRKAAKRLRYAAETARSVDEEAMKLVVKKAKAVQSALGEHHDAVMTRAILRHLALDEAVGEAAAFLLGHLDADEQRAMVELEQRAWATVADLQDTLDATL
jgi:CHAD domain-containing protein